MKKSLVLTLALVFVLGIAGTAFAANPFTDVPANHWAYASISKLAQAGIIDGYGDGRFIGNNTMTRYEMAQIVAKAMAKVDSADAAQRSQIEKLAAEFADELDSLGVRVAKLEKNADNVKITGEARFANYSYDNKLAGDNESTLRSRIWLSGEVNDRWNYYGMFENTHDFKTNSRAGEQNVNLRRAWVEGSLGVINVTAGSFNYITMYGTVIDNDMDGLVLNYKNSKFSVDLFAGRPDGDNPFFGGAINTGIGPDAERNNLQNYTMYGTWMNYAFNDKFNAHLAYYNIDGSLVSNLDADIFEIGVDYKFNKDFMMWAEYLRGDRPKAGNFTVNGVNYNIPQAARDDMSKNGWAVGMQFGQTDREKVGSWQVTAAYYDVPQMASIVPTTEMSINSWGDGWKGWTAGVSFMAAKNIDLNFEYFDFKTQGDLGAKEKDKLMWSYVRFYF